MRLAPSTGSTKSRSLHPLPERADRCMPAMRPAVRGGKVPQRRPASRRSSGRSREGLRRSMRFLSRGARSRQAGRGERRQRPPCHRAGALAVHGIASQDMEAFLYLTATSPASPAGNLLHFCRFASKALMPSAVAGTHCTCTGLASPIYFLTHAL